MRAQLGVERERRVSPLVERGEIRRWAIAVYWPERPPRIYWDEEYARTTRWGGVIAPPDFNPFTWPVDEEGFNAKIQNWLGQTRGGGQAQAHQPSQPGTRVLNGGSRVEYHNPIRPGDVITAVSKLVDLQEREGGRTGLMLFSYTETRWTNQKGELVKVTVGTGIRY
ncbi:MAG: MaoC family dehydratase [SAR202 cluster bacterium]|nr:MaoC family dehydratase [SAR202 cluster bacterium]